MNIFILLAIILTLCLCENQNGQSYQEEKFSIPYINKRTIDKDSVRKKSTDFLSDTWAPFIGKFKFSDTISISEIKDSSIIKDFVDGFYSESNLIDTLNSDGFQIIPDYNQLVPYRAFPPGADIYYFPVFVINETPSVKIFIGKDSYVFAIQEAKDSEGVWYPIEAKAFDFCGVGYWGLKVHPNEFITFLLPVYEGNFITDIRVRLKIGNTIYVSKPFQGKINSGQFNFQSTWPEKTLEEKFKMGMIIESFYGSYPKDFWD